MTDEETKEQPQEELDLNRPDHVIGLSTTVTLAMEEMLREVTSQRSKAETDLEELKNPSKGAEKDEDAIKAKQTEVAELTKQINDAKDTIAELETKTKACGETKPAATPRTTGVAGMTSPTASTRIDANEFHVSMPSMQTHRISDTASDAATPMRFRMEP